MNLTANGDDLIEQMTQEDVKAKITVGNGLVTTHIIGKDMNFRTTRDQTLALIREYLRALDDPNLDVHTDQIP